MLLIHQQKIYKPLSEVDAMFSLSLKLSREWINKENETKTSVERVPQVKTLTIQRPCKLLLVVARLLQQKAWSQYNEWGSII